MLNRTILRVQMVNVSICVSASFQLSSITRFFLTFMRFVFEVKVMLPDHSGLSYWLFVMLLIIETKQNTNLTLLHSSLVAVEQSVKSGAVVHHKHSSSRPFGGHAPFPLDVQCHLNGLLSIILTRLITSQSKLRGVHDWQACQIKHSHS